MIQPVLVEENMKSAKRIHKKLEKYFLEDPDILEIGVDEVGRGPMFGRVYTAAVILPKDDTFDHSLMKDSKRFSSKKRLRKCRNISNKMRLRGMLPTKTRKQSTQ